MSKDPFEPPNPFGEDSKADLSLDVAEGFQLQAKRQPDPESEEPAKGPLTGAQAAKACLPHAKNSAQKSGEVYQGVLDEAAMQRKLYVWAPPIVFALGFLFMYVGGGGFVRIFFGMWLHELGHATSAWVTGHWAIPGPWRTSIAPDRCIKVTLAMLGVIGFIAYRAWHGERKILCYAMGALALFVLVCTFGVSKTSARTAITFFGDAGMMIYGGALVLTFWAPVGSHIHTSWLRWGFIVIGSLAFLDGVFTWWPARKDASVIPYGEIEGVGLSDPTKLVDVSRWTQQELIDRHIYVIYVVSAILVARWAYGVWRIHQDEDVAVVVPPV